LDKENTSAAQPFFSGCRFSRTKQLASWNPVFLIRDGPAKLCRIWKASSRFPGDDSGDASNDYSYYISLSLLFFLSAFSILLSSSLYGRLFTSHRRESRNHCSARVPCKT
jgi:hypothetical protein